MLIRIHMKNIKLKMVIHFMIMHMQNLIKSKNLNLIGIILPIIYRIYYFI